MGESPRVAQPPSVERPEKGGHEDQDSLVDRPGDGEEADPGEPAEGARDTPVAGEEPDGADCAVCASHEGKTTRRPSLVRPPRRGPRLSARVPRRQIEAG